MTSYLLTLRTRVLLARPCSVVRHSEGLSIQVTGHALGLPHHPAPNHLIDIYGFSIEENARLLQRDGSNPHSGRRTLYAAVRQCLSTFLLRLGRTLGEHSPITTFCIVATYTVSISQAIALPNPSMHLGSDPDIDVL
ncbi:MAG: hypothetical protein R3228_08650 [Halioglobus sp.]|nr:hypothetical protein [Halioglobus sp.]